MWIYKHINSGCWYYFLHGITNAKKRCYSIALNHYRCRGTVPGYRTHHLVYINWTLKGSHWSGVDSHNCFSKVTGRYFASRNDDIATLFIVKKEDEFTSRVLQAKIPIIVAFYAEWAEPIDELFPSIREDVQNREGDVMLAKVNVDVFNKIAYKYKVFAVPTLMLFKKGKPCDVIDSNSLEANTKDFVNKALEET